MDTVTRAMNGGSMTLSAPPWVASIVLSVVTLASRFAKVKMPAPPWVHFSNLLK